ncbi:anti-repressor SinI family protein [Neobacillus drentensis]
MDTNSTNEKELDNEWVDLVLEARNIGISVEEIRNFLIHSA